MVIAREGDTATLVCDVCMEPWGTVTWSRPASGLPTKSSQSDETLTIYSITQDEFGLYICEASNTILSVKHSSTFVISVLPQGPPAQPTDLTVMASTSVSVTLGWTCGHNGGDDNMWFILNVVNEDKNYTINIPADCGVGERHNPDYRVEMLDGSSFCTFLLTAHNRFTYDVEILQTANISTLLPGG